MRQTTTKPWTSPGTYRRKANIPGFRPGMVPMGIINKMYRKGVVAEEAYRTASKACFDYIETEKLTTVGDMIPSQKQQPLDFDNDTEYEFVFEVGIAPEVQISLSKKDKVTKYTIRVEDKMREGYRSNFLRRFGRLVDVEKVEKEEALDVTLEQGDTKIEEAYVGLIGMSDEDRAPFVGKKVGDTMEVDVTKLYKTPSQRASVLGVKEAELEGMDPNYRLTITKIRKFAEPELNEEFFKTAFPDGGIKTAEEFEQYVTRQIEGDLARESGFLFSIDVRKFLLKKAALVMPEAFLKNWLYTINEGKFTMEQIEKDFAQFVDMMCWNLIQKHFVSEMKLEVTPRKPRTRPRQWPPSSSPITA
ncbi:MAG: trigger factor [Alistipes sp.]